MAKRTLLLLLLALTLLLASPAVAETAPGPAADAGLWGLPNGTVALYAASGVFMIVALCLVKKRRATALLLLVMAGLLAYVGYSLVQAQEKAQQTTQGICAYVDRR